MEVERENRDWSRSWSEFVSLVVKMHEDGSSDNDISRNFIGGHVEWEGKIASINLYEEYSPGIGVSMGFADIDISENRIFRANHVFIRASPEDASKWSEFSICDKIKLKTAISVGQYSENFLNLFNSRKKPFFVLEISIGGCCPVL